MIRVTLFHFSLFQTMFLIPLRFFIGCILVGVPGCHREPSVRQQIDVLQGGGGG